MAGIHTAQACTPSRKTDRTSKHNEIHQHIIIKGSLDEKLPSYELLKMLKETDQ